MTIILCRNPLHSESNPLLVSSSTEDEDSKEALATDSDSSSSQGRKSTLPEGFLTAIQQAHTQLSFTKLSNPHQACSVTNFGNSLREGAEEYTVGDLPGLLPQSEFTAVTAASSAIKSPGVNQRQ
eukprot:2102553-Ditylum_brightwellii.AAC.1